MANEEKSFWNYLNASPFVGLSLRKPPNGNLFKPGDGERAEAVVAMISMNLRHSPRDAKDIAAIDALDRKLAATRDYVGLRVEKTAFPLESVFRQTNEYYLPYIGAGEMMEPWNAFIKNYMLTVYTSFQRFVCGTFYAQDQGKWLSLPEPKMEEKEEVAGRLLSVLARLDKPSYTRALTRENKFLLRHLRGHLAPFARTRGVEGPKPSDRAPS